MQQGDLKQAESTVARALVSAPRNPALHLVLARVRISQRRYAEAEKAADTAIQLSPRDAQAHGIRARALVLSHRLTRAHKSIVRALALQPNRAEWHRMLGRCHLDRGRPRDALRALNRALELDRASAWTTVLKGDALWKLDQQNQAEIAYRQGSKLPRDGPAWQAEALDRLATLLVARRQARKARQVLDECKRKFPEMGCPHAEAALLPPDPTQPHKGETHVKPPSRAE